MIGILVVALDLLREAARRRWFVALAVALSVVLFGMAAFLRMDVIDGALAATSLFGKVVNEEIAPADVALRPVFSTASYVIFYGGLCFLIMACADFGPSLLSPGRIEHLLALPIARSTLLLGTFLGVVCIATLGALYGAGGFTLILGIKTGVWTLRLVVAALLAAATFVSIYGAILTIALFARSAAVSALCGLGLLLLGVVASHREEVALAFDEGLVRSGFLGLSVLFPPVARIGKIAAAIAGHQAIDLADLGSRVLGLGVFGLALVAVGIWRFERMDF